MLAVEDVCAENDRGVPALRDLSLQVRAGEIVGMAGVAGNGQSELAQVITGLRKITCGRVLINGEDVANQPAARGHQTSRGPCPRRSHRRGQFARPEPGRQPDHEELPRGARVAKAGC